MKDVTIYEWLIITTGIPYGQNTKGHLVIEGVGMQGAASHCHRTQFAWEFKDDQLVDANVVVLSSQRITQDISIVNNQGKTAFKIPGGPNAHATVSYVWTSEGYDDIKGWTVDKVPANAKTSGVYTELVLDVIQGYTNANEEIPVGVPIPWFSTEVPDGFLPYTGNGFDIKTFPKLGTLFPSGVLLDLTGDFLRAVEVGREVMSHQDQSVQPLGFAGDPHSHSVLTYAGKWGRGSGSEFWASNRGTITGETIATGTITGTGTETRPANTAVLYITKAG